MKLRVTQLRWEADGVVSVTLRGLAGERFVSALRIGALDGPSSGAGSLLNLFLATAGVGPNVAPPVSGRGLPAP